MAKEVIMPKLGMTMEEGEILKWHKEEGQEVKKGEVLLEVMSDKTALEVESNFEGLLLKRIYNEGDVVPVLETIAIIGKEGEDISGLLVKKDKPEDTPAQKIEETENQKQVAEAVEQVEAEEIGKPKASPAAKRLARENDIDLSLIDGTGPGGRIIEDDVLKFISQQRGYRTTPAAQKLAQSEGVDLDKIAGDGFQRIYKDDVLQHISDQDTTKVMTERLSGVRKTGAERLSMSWRMVPHVTLTAEVDMKNTLELRSRLNERLKETNKKISVTDILLKAIASALQKHPAMNAYLEDNTIHYNKDINVGLAVAVEDKLVVPVIKDVDKKNFTEIVEEKSLLIKKAKQNSLSREDITKGSFTLTNLGMFGIDIFTPIINMPESGILGVGQVKKKPVVIDDEIRIRPMMWLSLSFDHRLVNGAPAAEFLADIVKVLEEPELLLL